MSVQRSERRVTRGFTLTELLLAVALSSVVVLAVFRLVDVSLSLWSKGELRRGLVEQTAGALELFSADLRALHGGQKGDLLVEWTPVDADADGLRERAWPRLRMVRQASRAELARIVQRRAQDQAREVLADEQASPEDQVAARRVLEGLIEGTPAGGLVEVVWAVLPAPRDSGPPCEGVLWRGVRRSNEEGTGERSSFFAPGFFDASGRPPVGALDEVSGGVLWFGLEFATQTSIVHDGWRLGPELADASASWDAWDLARPDSSLHEWNEPGAGMPKVDRTPALPRRVRITLEFERERDRERRSRLSLPLDAVQATLVVDDGTRIPAPGSFVLVGAEWMQVTAVNGERIGVRRGVRASAPFPHDAGEVVHWGLSAVTEVRVPAYTDDWRVE